MTDISKLKAEAEEARENLVEAMQSRGWVIDSENLADAIIAATIAQIALQAAEKEANDPFLRHALKKIDELTPEKIKSSTRDYWIEFDNPSDPAPIADDGWIKWEGGECPVHSSAIVEIKCSCGRLEIGKPDEMHWNAPRDNDHIIIAYRIVTPAADRIEE